MAQVPLPTSLNERFARATTHSALCGKWRWIKRCADFLLAAPVLMVTAPLWAMLAVLVKLTSAGPVIYRQERVGLGGRIFTIYKFRTMYKDAEVNGPIWPLEPYGRDPRCTPVGRFLRWTGLDELPQLFNVLKGDMSLVGPRPERPEFAHIFSQSHPRYALRQRVRPGLTGWAQVKGLRGNSSIQERLKYDLAYIERWTPALDLKILFLTISVLFKNMLTR